MNNFDLELHGFGRFVYDAQEDEHRSGPLQLKLFNSKPVTVVLVGFADDEHPDDFIVTLQNLWTRDYKTLRDASVELNRYWSDFKDFLDEKETFEVASIHDLWEHVHPGKTVYVTRRHSGDKKVYVEIECNCDWEVEHGLQLVLREGLSVTKLGPYDGHLTNADAYADPTLEAVVYYGLNE